MNSGKSARLPSPPDTSMNSMIEKLFNWFAVSKSLVADPIKYPWAHIITFNIIAYASKYKRFWKDVLIPRK